MTAIDCGCWYSFFQNLLIDQGLSLDFGLLLLHVLQPLQATARVQIPSVVSVFFMILGAFLCKGWSGIFLHAGRCGYIGPDRHQIGRRSGCEPERGNELNYVRRVPKGAIWEHTWRNYRLKLFGSRWLAADGCVCVADVGCTVACVPGAACTGWLGTVC